MSTFNLKTFTVDPISAVLALLPWGNGHTLETDPERQGWRCRLVKGRQDGILLIGQVGVSGCASLRIVDGAYDVAVYDDTPAKVAAYLQGGEYCDADFHDVSATPGFGLAVIRLIKSRRAEIARYEADLARRLNS